MVSGSEMKALKTVARESGETTTRLVCRQLGIDASYATMLCNSLISSEHLAREGRGRFKITSKGRKALGWSGKTVCNIRGHGVPAKGIQKEEFHWRSVNPISTRHAPVRNGFPKNGQDEGLFRLVSYGNTRWGNLNGSAQISLLKEKDQPCGCCRGTGRVRGGATCSVCRGTGRVIVVPPAVSCAFCKGRGIERRTGRACPVCRGKGVVSVRVPIGVCSQCNGSGMEQGTALTCLKCAGKGVIHLVNGDQKTNKMY